MAKDDVVALPSAVDRQAWLVMSKAAYRRLGGGEKYDDDPSRRYSWDSTVPNHRNVRPGDIVVLWDEVESLGASVVERITTGHAVKRRGRCTNPACRTTNYEPRKTIRPIYRCYDCGAEFDDPVFEDVDVETYRSDHGQAWVDLAGDFSAKELRAFCEKPKSQNSFRALNWDAFRAAAKGTTGADMFGPLDAVTKQIQGGHTTRPTRVRLGQKEFRKSLLARYKTRCAFTGDLPETVLDACHLYSYAKVGKHHEHGGILLRRDLHTLFDRGEIAVDTNDLIDVSDHYRGFATYGELHGKPLTITVTPEQRTWFELHWTTHRKGDS
ncbi:HNH endonuclease signature motif containing protein [Nocardia vaccinii]|uniref:HNH endonuclease signature motif containing protein n=1 Tax=Nocardia vaccinii TaxID=1822 RepID=UPI00082B8044|nr:HNH endonuclease signature motif containing protein [Nocardia vaccinii]